MLDTKSIKKDFPILINNPNLTYLDSAASSLKPACVINKIKEYYEEYGVNVHRGVYGLSYKATDEYEETREVVAKFLNAKAEEIVFTKGATSALNLVAASYGMANINEGDEIIVSELEHHSSVMPWQEIVKIKKAKLVFVPLDSEGRITVENFKKVLTSKTKVVALTYVSNVMGYVSPIKEIIELAHVVNATVIVDAAQAAPHLKIDVKELNADFLAFSAHKMLGPSGLGVLYGKYKLLNSMNPIEFGGDMNDYVEKYDSTFKDAPYKFEAGTPLISEVIAFKEAIYYLEKIGMDNIHTHEQKLMNLAMAGLKEIDGITVYNKTCETGVISFNINGIHPHDAATIFDQNNVALRAGHHCAQLITSWLGCVGTLRASFYLYNDAHDVEVFINSVKQAAEYFKEWNI
ncbi:MAG: SufS family cysteine desulfurase [Bacilli bacterium]|nr:SufS family cysteine desulfurase [Bacilli bacterium]